MIERYTLTSLDHVAAVFGAPPPEGSAPRFNVAPMQQAPIATATGVVLARWGLLPPWRGHGGKRDPHVMRGTAAQAEAVPLLRNAFKQRRCLVIADGFFAWRRVPKKQPVWIHPAPEPASRERSRTIGFAGVSATHRDDGQPSFAILVGAAGPLVAPLDETMPLVIGAADYATWLTGSVADARALLAAAAGLSGWRADPVSDWANSADHDDPRCVELLGNPAQGELF